MSNLIRASKLVFILATLAWAASQVHFHFFNYDFPNSTSTLISAINNSGRVVGNYGTASSYGQGFVRSPGGSVEAIVLPWSSTDSPATGINSAGDIVGAFYNPTTNMAQGYLRTAAGVYSIIADPVNPNNSGAYAINDLGQTVGTYADLTNVVHGFFRDAQGNYQTIDDPNVAPGPSGKYSFLNGLNNAGQMVGTYTDAVGEHGFLYSRGAFLTIDVPNSQPGSTGANGINNLGQIVGTYYDASNVSHGFIRSADGATFVTVVDPSSQSGSLLLGINDHGQLVGSYGFPRHGFFAQPVHPQ